MAKGRRQKTISCGPVRIVFRYAYQKMQNGLNYMFFMKEKNFGSKGKILIFFENIGKFLTDTLANMSQNIFADFSVSEHSASFLFF